MSKFPIAFMAFALLMMACSGKQTAAPADVAPDVVEQEPAEVAADSVPTDTLDLLITETPMPRAADELFDDFLFNFAANRRLQAERVAFPLPVTRNGKTTRLNKADWQMDHFFMRQGYYTLLFDSPQQMEVVKDTSVSQAVVEKIYFNTGAVISYDFRRLGGAWMLCSVDTKPISANANADFLAFYHEFVTDTLFQAGSLSETVLFTGPDPDDDFSEMEGVITPDTWPVFAPELPDRMIYNIVYGHRQADSDTKIFVIRGIANGEETVLTFRRQDGKWRLQKMNT